MKTRDIAIMGGVALAYLYFTRPDIFPKFGGEPQPPQKGIIAPTISSPGFEDAGHSTIPEPIQNITNKVNAVSSPTALTGVKTSQIDFTPVVSTSGGAIPGTTETTISNVRLTPTGLAPDRNFKVQITSVGSVKESFSSRGFDAFGNRLPVGELSSVRPITTSSGAPIPVVKDGVVHYYSPKAFEMEFGKK